ncbi:MAG: hypothetical protein WED04_11840 [Promethearchaeati archaeon SRVP18_Atabeyarchaeia-1]
MAKKRAKKIPAKNESAAEEIARAMTANMAANQENPNWDVEHDRMMDEAAARALKTRPDPQ